MKRRKKGRLTVGLSNYCCVGFLLSNCWAFQFFIWSMARAGLSTNGTGPGYLGGMKYSDIVDFNLANNASVVFDEETDWIGYDDTESISNKLNFAPANGLGGYFFWAVGFDKNWTISAAGFHGMGLSKLNNGGKSLMRAKGSMDNLHEAYRGPLSLPSNNLQFDSLLKCV
ncbi:unnamed protein product [Camellia sinensis]